MSSEQSVVSFGEALRVWPKIGFLSFGGPAGQIALMHKLIVDEKRWIGEERFLHALNYCTLLPGPEAQQLATYIGWLLHAARGGLTAGLLFIVPGAHRDPRDVGDLHDARPRAADRRSVVASKARRR